MNNSRTEDESGSGEFGVIEVIYRTERGRRRMLESTSVISVGKYVGFTDNPCAPTYFGQRL
ncbi:MAG: hypothetical protein M3R69_09065 [Acidobacteriota bacterium]|nr:hypothetical protein [Acidobacteriota bacterium]